VRAASTALAGVQGNSRLADAVEAMAAGDTDEERRARWLVWLRSYAARVEREVVRGLPDPERGPEAYWRY
jgi:hypothetical protein